jgi:hypothetical protein
MTSPISAYLLQAYLNRELDRLVEEEFELELLRDPQLAQLAFADTVLGIGLNVAEEELSCLLVGQGKQMASDLSDPSSPKICEPKPTESVLTRLQTQTNSNIPHQIPKPPAKRTLWHYAAAAMVVMGLAGAMGYQLNRQPQRTIGATLAYIDKQRAPGGQITVTLPKSGALVLMVPVASAQACLAQIGLNQHGATAHVTAQADDFGYACLILAPQDLVPGPLSVSVRCEGASQLLGAYEVLVVAKR